MEICLLLPLVTNLHYHLLSKLVISCNMLGIVSASQNRPLARVSTGRMLGEGTLHCEAADIMASSDFNHR